MSSLDELVARIEALERKEIAVTDLPFADIQRKLARTWRQDGNDSLLKGTVGPDVLTQPEIHVPTLANGWTAQAGYATPRASKTGHGMVTINAVLDGTACTGSIAFTLPAGWRPSAAVGAALNYYIGPNRAIGSVIVDAAGTVRLLNSVDGIPTVSNFLVHITFSTAA